jgi:hypothetical protein
MAEDGSKAKAFGPEAISNPATTVGVSEIGESTLKVYPNPATNDLNIDYDKAPYNVLLFNSVGILLQSEVAENPLHKMNVGHLNKGLYLIRIQDDENFSVTKKVIIE